MSALRPVWLLAVMCAGAVSACGGNEVAGGGPSGSSTSSSTYPANTPGAPCQPAIESSPTYNGASISEVGLDNHSCGGGNNVCLTYHFEGLTYCPYGQSADGVPPPGASACTNAATGETVAGAVEPQCTDRRAADAVFCSCRCANAQGTTNDGASYCSCTNGTMCQQIIAPIPGGPSNFEGAYCMTPSSAYVADRGCGAFCDPATAVCD